MTAYANALAELRAEPRRWLITGVAGFIGSHLLELLLRQDQHVAGLDNFSTGSPRNLDDVRKHVSDAQWARFTFREGSIADIGACREASNHADFVLHQAGFVSVPLSLEDPIACHNTNVTGMLNILVAARDNHVRRVVYASSSAVYGDDDAKRKIETQTGCPLSPYGASKAMGEMYARQFADHYGLATTGLRYFNVFGPRQSPAGGYAAVIPQWIDTLVRGGECTIHGDGTATRDFAHIADIVQANILAAVIHTAPHSAVYNVALGGSTTIRELYEIISAKLATIGAAASRPVKLGPPRAGDILHSAADVAAITRDLGFAPEVSVDAGLEETVRWYAAGV
jgi:UDP-N-acetylglucosamine 4-epimerase